MSQIDCGSDSHPVPIAKAGVHLGVTLAVSEPPYGAVVRAALGNVCLRVEHTPRQRKIAAPKTVSCGHHLCGENGKYPYEVSSHLSI